MRLERGSAPRGDGRVLGDDVVLGCRLGVVDDLRRVGAGLEQRGEDPGMDATPRGSGHARRDRMAGQLVPEADVAGLDLEQPAALRLLGGRGPVRHHRVEHRDGHAVRDHRHELEQNARGMVEPRGATSHRVRDRLRKALLGRAGEQLGDVERVAARGRVDAVGAVAGQGRDRAVRQRRQLEEHRMVGRDGADRGVEGMPGGNLAVAEGDDEERRQRADAAAEHGERIERRLVRPVHVLQHENGGVGRKLELLDEQRLDVVRRRPCRERARELRRDASGEVAERAERPRDRKVVARADEHARPRVEPLEEPRDERRLADSRLAVDEDGAALAMLGRSVGVGERRERMPSLE